VESKVVYRWIFGYLISPSILAPMLAFAWSRFKGGYQNPSWIQVFFWVQLFDLAQGSVFIGLAIFHQNNQWLRHLAQPIVFLGFLWTMFRMAPDSRARRILYGICLTIGLMAAMTGLWLNGVRWRNAVFTTTMSLIYLGLVTRELKILSESNEDATPTSLPAFWVLASLLVYSSGTLIFNASSNYFLRTLSPLLLPIPWVVVGFIHVIHEVMLAKVFLCPKPTSS
jgi:hypothetical protein